MPSFGFFFALSVGTMSWLVGYAVDHAHLSMWLGIPLSIASVANVHLAMDMMIHRSGHSRRETERHC